MKMETISSAFDEWSGQVAMLAGFAYVADVIIDVAVASRYTTLVHLLAAFLTLVAIVGIHRLQKNHYGRAGQSGFWMISLALIAQIVGRIGELWDPHAFSLLIFPIGIFLMMAGVMVYGWATWQARVLPRWVGLGFLIVPPVAIALAITASEQFDAGEVLFGLLWIAVGYALWSRENTPGW